MGRRSEADLFTVVLFLLLISLGPAVAGDHPLISAHTSGEIPRDSKVLVQFIDPVDRSVRESRTDPLTFTPAISGKVKWADARTLQFIPDKWLPPGVDYKAVLDLATVGEDSEKRFFSFSFKTMQQDFEISFDGFVTPDKDNQTRLQVQGVMRTADVSRGRDILRTVTADQSGQGLNVSWTHEPGGREHRFVVAGIKRLEALSVVTIRWNGDPLGVDRSGKKAFEVEPVGPFKVSEARPIQGADRRIDLIFSDPVDKRQNLSGLIRIKDEPGLRLRYRVAGNRVSVYQQGLFEGEYQVAVEKGVRNISGARLKQGVSVAVSFEHLKPAVKFVGKRTIWPTTRGLTIPVETANLKGLVVSIKEIYNQNIPQFLQVNNLSGSSQINRVGRNVLRRVIPLNFVAEQRSRWVRQGLDISSLVQDNPGGIYRIELSFLPEHIVYPCQGLDTDRKVEPRDLSTEQWSEAIEESFWNMVEGGVQNRNDMYRQRENPCHPGYYQHYYDHNITVARNIFVSDLGLIAKRGSDNRVIVAVNDLKTTRPLSGVELTLLDYQHQAVGRARSDQDGMAVIYARGKPFLLVADGLKDRGYLKLDDGSALSVSHFDVAGHQVQKGLKGFLYGERGVWRPGDPLHLTFVLEDKAGTLPPDHPVTLELSNPRGQVVTKMINRKPLNGFYRFTTRTASDAPTGNWLAAVRVGGAVFKKTLKIETVKPNRLKIKLDFGKETKALSGDTLSAELSSTWLHGAIAKNLAADIKLTFTPRRTRFPKYEEYTFDDPVRSFQTESHTLFEGSLDDTGRTRFSEKVSVDEDAPGMLTARFETRVFEPGGAFSIDRFAMPYHPFKQYVGIRTPKGDKARGMLQTDRKHTVRFALLDVNGRPVPKGSLDVKLYKINWRWWWEKKKESFANFLGSSAYQELQSGTVSIDAGRGEWSFEVKYPDWGRYMVRAVDSAGNHIAGRIIYIDWPGWAGKSGKDIPGAASVLTFSTDKEVYRTGDTVRLTIPTGKTGRGLVSVESGSKVIHTDWLTPEKAVTQYEFKATRDMVPNVFLNVTYLQPHLQTANDLPIRMYGVVPIRVEDPVTRLSPILATPDTFKPGETATIEVKESQGRAMTYTLAVVDEGLLDLTRFRTPSPWDHFFRREALGVKTWDVYDLVAGAYGGVLEQLLALGGDTAGKKAGSKKANRFPPMVRFLGPFELQAGETTSHQLEIPQYVGSVRVMLVAGQDGAYGSAEQAVFVRKPLMLLGTLPRVIGPQEQVEMPVSIFAMDKKVRDVTVTVETEGPLAVDGAFEKSVSFSEPGDELVRVRLKAGDRPGVGRVHIRADSDGETATQTIELDVRVATFRVTDVAGAVLKPGETWAQNAPLPGMSGTNRATLEVSRIPPLNLEKRLRELIRYPHGCVEQITSAVFPQLYLHRLVELTPEARRKISQHIRTGIARLGRFQLAGGGFGYWPGAEDTNAWATSYVGHFLVEARNAGYIVPARMIASWQKFQRNRAALWEPDRTRSDLIQAYRLYTLALSGSPDLGAMNRIREAGFMKNPARFRLAAAYQLAGQPEAAEQLVDAGTTQVRDYRELSNTFGSALRDKAMMLETLVLMDRSAAAFPLVKEIADQLASRRWLSTQATAWALVSVARLTGLEGVRERDRQMRFTYSWDENPEENLQSGYALFQQVLAVEDGQSGNIRVRNTGKVLLYPRLIMEGLPAPGGETAAAQGMALKVSYETLSGEALKVQRLEQGTDFVAVVAVRNNGTRAYQEVALSHLFPSGWEIHNERLAGEDAEETGVFKYRDIRDDRVYTYFDLGQGKSLTTRIKLTAAYPGRYCMPMIGAETMYDATIHARVPGGWVTVYRPGQE